MTAWLLGANVQVKGSQAGSRYAPESESKKVIEMLSPSKTEAGVMSHAESDTRWKSLYRIGGVAALVGVALIPIQIIFFVFWPPPTTVTDWFTLFQDNWLLGLLSLDLLYILNNALLGLMYLAPYAALRRVSESLMAIALTLGLVGIAAYFASTIAFEMLSLSNQYAAAATDAQRDAFLAAGQAMLAIYKRTAFDVYYVLNAVVLFMIAPVMLRSGVFSKATAYAGLAAGVLMIVPSTAGTLGLIFSLASLVPWAMFAVLVARSLFQLGRGISTDEASQGLKGGSA
jgi:hypothetical protein